MWVKLEVCGHMKQMDARYNVPHIVVCRVVCVTVVGATSRVGDFLIP